LPEVRAPGLVAIVAVIVLIAIGSAFAGCSPEGGNPDSVEPSATVTIRASEPPGETSDPAETTPAPLVVDPALLAILPARVAGVTLAPSPDSASELTADPSLQDSASAIAVGAAIDPAGSDLAVASVIQLRPGVYSDTFFADWRTTYDAAACDPAGGVKSHVRQILGSYTAEVTTCAQGARTYHVLLPGDIIVSVTAVGDRKFGDLVIAALRR
jgi:hypothetical protein